MLFKIQQNIFINLVFILFGTVLLWLSLAHLEAIYFDGKYSLLNISSIKNNSWLNAIFALLVLISAYVIFRINKAQRFVEGNSLPFMLFTSLGLSASIVSNVSITDTFAVLLSLLSLSLVLQIHNQKSVLGLLFLSSIMLSISAVLFYPSLFLFSIPLLNMAFFRPFEVRDYAVVLVGFSLVLFYLFCLSYLLDVSVTVSNIDVNIRESMIPFALDLLPLVLFSLFSMIGALKLFFDRTKFVARQRNQLLVIAVYVIIQLVLFLILQNAVFWVSMVPILSIFLSYYYKTNNRKWLLDLVSLLFIVALIWLKF